MTDPTEQLSSDRCEPEQSEGADALSQAEPGEGTASSKTHRFDKFARKLAGSMLAALRETLSVFDLPDKDRWPTEKLLNCLKAGEELAREMLTEIAAKIYIFPAKLRERREAESAPREISTSSKPRTPLFKLFAPEPKERPFAVDVPNQPESVPLSRFAGEGSGVRAAESDALAADSGDELPDPPPAAGRGRRGSESLFDRRLAALEDVLAHPGKHAARMARALYRKEHDAPKARLVAKSEQDMILVHIARFCADPSYQGTPDFERWHAIMLEAG